MYMGKDKRCCLTEGFFSQLDTVYENCYRINPNPSETFLDRMQLIEIQARRLRDQLEEIQADSYRYLEPKKITDEERTMLKDYDHSGLIVKAFMPYISMAFCLTASNPEAVNSMNSSDMSFVENLLSIKDLSTLEELKQKKKEEQEVEQEIDQESDQESEKDHETTAVDPLIELPEIGSVYFNHPVRSIYQQLPMNSTSNPELFSDEVLIPEVISCSQGTPVVSASAVETSAASTATSVTSETSLEFQDDSKYQNFEEDFEQLIKDTCLNWKDIQSCYPDSSIVMFLQQVSGSAEIRFNKDFNPVLHVKSLKGSHHYEYELNEYAFKYDIDNILSETVVDQLQNLVDDLEA